MAGGASRFGDMVVAMLPPGPSVVPSSGPVLNRQAFSGASRLARACSSSPIPAAMAHSAMPAARGNSGSSLSVSRKVPPASPKPTPPMTPNGAASQPRSWQWMTWSCSLRQGSGWLSRHRRNEVGPPHRGRPGGSRGLTLMPRTAPGGSMAAWHVTVDGPSWRSPSSPLVVVRGHWPAAWCTATARRRTKPPDPSPTGGTREAGARTRIGHGLSLAAGVGRTRLSPCRRGGQGSDVG